MTSAAIRPLLVDHSNFSKVWAVDPESLEGSAAALAGAAASPAAISKAWKRRMRSSFCFFAKSGLAGAQAPRDLVIPRSLRELFSAICPGTPCLESDTGAVCGGRAERDRRRAVGGQLGECF